MCVKNKKFKVWLAQAECVHSTARIGKTGTQPPEADDRAQEAQNIQGIINTNKSAAPGLGARDASLLTTVVTPTPRGRPVEAA